MKLSNFIFFAVKTLSAALINHISASFSISGTGLSPRPSDGRSVCVSACPESVLWQNGWVDPDAVSGAEWCRSRDGCIRWGWFSSKGKRQFWGEVGASHCDQRGHCFVVVRERRTLPKLLRGMTCYRWWWCPRYARVLTAVVQVKYSLHPGMLILSVDRERDGLVSIAEHVLHISNILHASLQWNSGYLEKKTSFSGFSLVLCGEAGCVVYAWSA